MSRRGRTGIAAAGAAIALLAPVGTGHAASPESPTDTPAAPRTTLSSFDDLPSGPPPTVSWFADGAFHRADQSWPFGPDPVDSFVEADGGFVASTDASDDQLTRQLAWVGTDGTANVIAEGALTEPVAATTGGHVAWTRFETDDHGNPVSSTVVVADPQTGDTVAELDGYDLTPVGFTADHLVVNSQDPDRASVLLWDYRHDTTMELTGYFQATAAEDTAGRFAVTGELDDGRWVSAVLDSTDGNRELWRSTERRVDSFAPDGKSAATVDIEADGLGASDFSIVDAETGDLILGSEVDLTQRFAWEPGNTLVLDAWVNDEQALVRCIPAEARCELATEPEPAGEPVDPATFPYLLVSE